MNTIMVVDDDQNILKVIKMRLEANDYQVSTAFQATNAVKIAQDRMVDLALVDLKLADDSGIDLMENLLQINPEMPIIILTSHGTIETAVEAMKKGAFGYVTKPFNYQELLLQIKNGLQRDSFLEKPNPSGKVMEESGGFENIVGNSEKIKKIFEQVIQASKTDSHVHIYGESGTGKELIAKCLHQTSSRKEQPFVAINCAAIPEALFESELFGYEKGAFTGANQKKKGIFSQAHTGTLFLDEISEMPLSLQAKLLRVLEDTVFYPLGGESTIQVDVRIIVASNKDLKKEVENGTFREDLYYRVHVINIKLPPLRERKEDIPLLARYFLKKYTSTMNKKIKDYSSAALQKMMLHHWPGNVRELENTVEYAVVMAVGDVITDDLILSSHEDVSEGLKCLKSAKEDFEKDYLVQLIGLTHGNVSQAAKLAGKYRADLYELLKKYDLKPINFRKK
ncbi:MAG: sigma-54-dependent Fis family transcriptional regulator [Candidatus Scalindua sp. AMX11]|nr:MAG: sigma-54-dependent Fis family transcriptional regulator [Candidatus Scalindua sp.]NOG84508.1 sigma-54-dependent Fis family transcriptional regulator [Planctomycetota bacterium]RZV80484.1 MAG: sigma-54-dependent Fis family transcriptional regulator [Candidatus Scalindua sp. SCAELEC01]TDE65295.1 MAG: sigma-54-dependent Fis family transcriptional regulator [Candidatus Scalindua sp. AMX11]GJQ58508.1 MAG: sigma-54-dependent Fis family transcriptional regulator [Candidatus Scalindua sp.]